MKGSELFKYDVRVRERMLKKGLLSDKAVAEHLQALPDREGATDALPLDQPALGRHQPGEPRPEGNGAEVPRGMVDEEDET